MKFNEIEEDQWTSLSPYLDTCLLPVTGLSGNETPHEVTVSLEKLRDHMELVELPFKGRVVTYPAFHYYEAGEQASIERVCRQLKLSGFRYVVLITAKTGADLSCSSVDLMLSPAPDGEVPPASDIRQAIQHMWQSNASAAAGETDDTV